MSGGTLRATTGDTPNASSGTLAALSVVSNKSKTQLSGGTIYARAGVSNDDRSYGMRILGTGSTLTMTNTEDAAQPLSLYVTGRNTALYATALADGGLPAGDHRLLRLRCRGRHPHRWLHLLRQTIPEGRHGGPCPCPQPPASTAPAMIPACVLSAASGYTRLCC